MRLAWGLVLFLASGATGFAQEARPEPPLPEEERLVDPLLEPTNPAPTGEPAPAPADPEKDADSSRAKKLTESEPDASGDGEYRTPLAGRPLKTTVFGTKVDLDSRDRGDTLALSIGATGFTPNVAGTTLVPFAALYYKRITEDRRFRGVFSVLVNTVDFAEHFVIPSGTFDAVAHFDNSTIPFPSSEIVDGEDLEQSEVKWGWNSLRLGAGYRRRMWPFNIDNDVRFQLSYQASYYYFRSTSDTGEIDGNFVTPINVPPDTYVHGLRAHFGWDMIQRNIMELPHYGIAGGLDMEFLRRDRWEDLGPLLPNGTRQFKKEDTRDFLRLTAYVVVALPIPGLSERHRLLLKGHVGWAPPRDIDRYNGFRIGGGPPTSEADDLSRSPYAGANFNQFNLRRYFLATFEYRFEVFFWLYLHLRATVGWAQAPTFENRPTAPLSPVRFKSGRGESYTVGVTSGFLFDSVVNFEYTYDSGAVRANDRGHTFLFSWSKSF
jgi:hypothetical protein